MMGEKECRNMRIMTILGSPRRQGNTAKVLGWIEEQFRGDGHEVDSANIIDYRVQGCGECKACKRGTVELCSIGDDANALFRRMAAADLVLVAAPVFCWGFPAQIKALIDRLFCMMDFDGERADVPRLCGKRMALLLTGGGEEADNGNLVVRGFEQLVEWLKARPAGHWFVGGCTEPGAISADLKARAAEFARAVAKDL
jgi:multimeric flavodoxin WrbA